MNLQYYSANSKPPPEHTPVLGKQVGSNYEERVELIDGRWCHAGGLSRPEKDIMVWRPAPGTYLAMQMSDAESQSPS